MTARKIARYGWRPDSKDHRDRIWNLEESVLQAHQVPPSVDLSPNMPPIYDQGQLGSCTANAIARCLEYEAGRQGEPMVTLSRLFIYYEERVIEGTVDQDSGAALRDGIKVVASEGAPPESAWPYDIARFAEQPSSRAYTDAMQHKAIQYRRVIPHGPGAPVRSVLASGLPIVFGFPVPAYFEDTSIWDPTSQVLPLPGPDDPFIGGHAATITGYDFSCSRLLVPAFQIDNSWSENWGISGRFWMDYRWLARLGSDFWTVQRVT